MILRPDSNDYRDHMDHSVEIRQIEVHDYTVHQDEDGSWYWLGNEEDLRYLDTLDVIDHGRTWCLDCHVEIDLIPEWRSG
jgi:hypothetical protein